MPDSLTLPARFNVADHFILPHQRPGRAERPYLICGESVLTFGALHVRANRAANALVRCGVRPGDRVALLMRESLEFPVMFWGAVRCGALPVPLNTVLTAPEYRYYLEDSEAVALVVDEALWARLAPALPGLTHLRHVLMAGSEAPEAPEARDGAEPLGPLLSSADPDFETRTAAPEDPAFWLYTSGSTGAPKAAVHRQRDMVHVATHYLPRVLGLRPDDLTFSAPKMFFAYGLGNSLYFPLAVGHAAVIDPAPATAASVFAVLERHRPSVFYAVPSLYRAMLAQVEAWEAGRELRPGGVTRPPRLEHLRMALSGGEVLPAEIFRRWRERFGVEILDGVGSTEALHFYLANMPGDAMPGSAGKPVPGYALKLVNEGGHEAETGEVGELWLQGGSLASGYWRKPGRNAQVFRGDWFATGDLFVKDAEGRYSHRGRKDDGFKVGGSWINPEEVEQALLSHPAVAECAVVGRPDGDGLMRNHAFVVPREGGGSPEGTGKSAGLDAPEHLERLLRAHLADILAAFKHPAVFHTVPSLPRTASGKVRRFLLRGTSGPDPFREGGSTLPGNAVNGSQPVMEPEASRSSGLKPNPA